MFSTRLVCSNTSDIARVWTSNEITMRKRDRSLAVSGGFSGIPRAYHLPRTAIVTSSNAAALGISTVTLWRATKKPEFAEAYRKARRDAFSQSVARLQHASNAAVGTLLRVMTG